MQNSNIYKFVHDCDELINSKMLFVDKNIDKLLTTIATSPEIYELVNECVGMFNKDKEFEKAFSRSSTGEDVFVMPKEEPKVIALVFCLLLDISNGKISIEELVSTFFLDANERLSLNKFNQQIVCPFKQLVCEAFGVEEKNNAPISSSESTGVTTFPVERTSNYLKDANGISQVFTEAKQVAIEMIERLAEERNNELIEDVTMMLHCVVISCMEQEFDLLCGIVKGLKYATKSIKSLKFLMRQLSQIVADQIDFESRK